MIDLSNLTNTRPTHVNERVLILDATNLFLRVWSSIPIISDTGEHIGGVVGFLRSVGVCIREFNPTRCILVFDGKGGSVRRRKLFPDYKQNRAGKHSLRRDIFTSAEDERDSMHKQLIRTAQYLTHLPVQTFCFDYIEADDAIAYAAAQFKGKVRIVSTDRDFLQLVSDNLEVYSPVKKKLYSKSAIEEEFGLKSDNYLIYRILTGDDSDNIDGVNGAGLKTLLKYFPELADKTVGWEYLYAQSQERANEKKCPKIVKTISESRELLDRNFKLMQLSDSEISGNTKILISERLSAPIPKMNRIAIRKMVAEDGLQNTFKNLDMWLNTTFNSLTAWTH